MSTIHIKTPNEIAKMRVAGRLAAQVLEMIEPYVKPGVTTLELNDICHNYIVNTQNAESACLYYKVGDEVFPKSICTSVNHVICHGIPDETRLKLGDILNIDITVKKDGYHGDTSKMFYVGECTKWHKKLCEVSKECLYLGIKTVKPGAKLGDIGAIIQKHAESNQYSVVREYCGHGIGSQFHEPGFQVLHYGKPGTGLELKPGMIFTIEPMINEGSREIQQLVKTFTDPRSSQMTGEQRKSHWTVAVTKDKKWSAQWEHTLLVTDTGVEILTLRDEERAIFA